MDFLITESQLKYILENNNENELTQNVKSLFSIPKEIYDRVKLKYGIDVKLLLTWGTAVGGFVAPLDNFIRTSEFDLTEDQISLILFGCVATLLLDNERYFREVYEIIKKEGLVKVFNKSLDKGSDLRNHFMGFLSSLNISVTNVVSLIRYSFLIPIIPDLMSYFDNTQDLGSTAELITKRILASGVVTVSSEILYQIIKRSLSNISK